MEKGHLEAEEGERRNERRVGRKNSDRSGILVAVCVPAVAWTEHGGDHVAHRGGGMLRRRRL